MKYTTIALLCLALSGCATTPGASPAFIDKVLDSTLPPTFTGPASIRHRNPYVTLVIEADGLKRGASGWEWQWLSYRREGRASEGVVVLGVKQP